MSPFTYFIPFSCTWPQRCCRLSSKACLQEYMCLSVCVGPRISYLLEYLLGLPIAESESLDPPRLSVEKMQFYTDNSKRRTRGVDCVRIDKKNIAILLEESSKLYASDVSRSIHSDFSSISQHLGGL
jgi:hypothetical protein